MATKRGAGLPQDAEVKAGFLAQHLRDLVRFCYDASPFEVDARAHEVRRER